ncbi:hypothetical protein EOL70_13620 [Leucothrix sargassi]|nr:hypothetical protein EOL70_13620 [Leucothrix sargassi]
MAKRTLPGLIKRKNGIWHIDKELKYSGRLCKTTGTRDYDEAERRARLWISEAEEHAIHGKPSRITFDDACLMYYERIKKPSIKNDLNDLRKVVEFLGQFYLDEIVNASLEPYIEYQREFGGYNNKGAKATTINRSIRTTNRLLNLCATEWRDEYNKPYLATAPTLKQIPENDKKPTHPIEYQEESRLLNAFSDDYKDLWNFATNTGLREQTQANLRWEWEVNLPMINTRAFIIPGEYLKYGRNITGSGEWLLVLNSTAIGIIDRWKGRDEEFVFPSPKGGKFNRFRNTHFKNARASVNLSHIDWHSARATFSTRLRAAGVGNEDRQQLMAHSTGNITTDYSWADVQILLNCVEKLCDPDAINKLSSIFRLDSLKKIKR